MIKLFKFLADNCLTLQVGRCAKDGKFLVTLRKINVFTCFEIDPVEKDDIFQQYFEPALKALEAKL